MAQQFDIIPTGTALGADITDFDIKIMDQEDAHSHPSGLANGIWYSGFVGWSSTMMNMYVSQNY